MEMDFPDLQELEWLEANQSNLPDEFDDEFLDLQQPPSPISESEPPQSPPQPEPRPPPPPVTKPILSLPPKVSLSKPQPEINPKKRLRYDDASLRFLAGNADSSPVEERSGGVNVDEGERESEKGSGGVDKDDDDEDWLRYSPPRPENGVADVAMVEEEVKEKFLSRFVTEIEGDCVPVTGLDGKRVYAKICRVGELEEQRRKKLEVTGNSSGLTLEPIRGLMHKVEHDEFSKALQASVDGENCLHPSDTPSNQEKLWVDKYAPNSFIELLSDEQTNREVVLWLKQWDSCVFGSDIKCTSDDVLSALKRHSSLVQHSKFSRNSFRRSDNSFYSNRGLSRTYQHQENNSLKDVQELGNRKQNQFGNPEQKILLLCGPPGLGKTTLAHVAARHCGYRVVEINASDDRSASTIESKILDAVQLDSVIADSKPKCLVIDEIDGALGDGKGAIDVILKMVSAERKSDTGKEATQDEQSGRKSSKKRRNLSLLRPVICICNDLYAPALRPLRQVAKVDINFWPRNGLTEGSRDLKAGTVFEKVGREKAEKSSRVHVFVQPTVSRVVNRLKYICNKEGVRASSTALTALVEYTECDIRSCLNTLQFLNKRKEVLNMLELSSQVVGQKDSSKSALDIWKEIFQTQRLKRGRKSMKVLDKPSNEFDFLLSLISNRGDYDLILDGIHENMLNLQYYDPVMKKTVKCLDKLQVSDIVHKYIMRTQQMSLLVYQPPTMLAIHGLVAQVNRPTIEWPKSFHRCRTILSEKREILHLWHTSTLPSISRHLSTKSFVEESVSPFLHILSPPTLKPVALHLLSEKEKREFAQLVSTMVSYAITYKNLKPCPSSGFLKSEDALDASSLAFDPPINGFINFKGYTSSHLVLASAVKQVLVHEVEKQKILQRASNSTDDCDRVTRAFSGKESSSSQSLRSCIASAPAGKQKDAGNLPTQQQLLSSLDQSNTGKSVTSIAKVRSPEKRKKPSGGSYNFFDRFRKVSGNSSDNVNHDIKRSETRERDLRPLLFKFNEGFTNAVKRPVRIREFLLW